MSAYWINVKGQIACPGRRRLIMEQRGPIRVLQVVGALDRGGIETWLMHVLRHIDRQRFAMDFLVHTEGPGAYDAEARALGASVLPCLRPARPWRYARAFRRILRRQ